MLVIYFLIYKFDVLKDNEYDILKKENFVYEENICRLV